MDRRGAAAFGRLSIVVLVATVLMSGVSFAGAQDPPDDDPGLASLAVFTGGCEVEPGSLVVSWEWTNHFEADVFISDLAAGVKLFVPPGGGNELVESIDLSHLFPTELAPGETVTIGPLVYPGDLMWSAGVSYTLDSEILDVPIVVGTLDIGPNPPCNAPPRPVETEPAFVG